MPQTLLVAFLICAILAAGNANPFVSRKPPVLTLTLSGLLCVFLVAQLLHPSLLDALARDGGRVFAGQWWRLATSLVVQDGGLAGGMFNILSFLVIGSLAETAFNRSAWLLILGLGAEIAEGVALVWQPVGAGNSVAFCSLAGALLAVFPFQTGGAQRVLRFIALIAAILLLLLRDIHGAAIAAGGVLGFILAGRGAQALREREKNN